LQQARHQDFAAVSANDHKGSTIFKYNSGCTQQTGGQTQNVGHIF